MTVNRHFPQWLVSVLLVVLSLQVPVVVDAAVSCEADEECKALFGWHSECLQEPHEGAGSCSSPFQAGCLQRLGNTPEQKGTIRLCNSDDFAAFEKKFNFSVTDNTIDGSGALLSLWEHAQQRAMVDKEFVDLKSHLLQHQSCRISDFNYPEIRIFQADWEASVFLAWIYQILLMEVVGVPATVGLTAEDTPFGSFYAVANDVPYLAAPGMSYLALDNAARQKRQYGSHDCLGTKENCAHLLPDVWGIDYHPFVRNNSFEPAIANGQIAKQSLYIPALTAQTYPELTSLYGLRGEPNRRKLAEIFKRPTTWGDYCQNISTNKCSAFDNTTTWDDVPAVRPPETEKEAAMYHSEGLYTGFFRATAKNDCDVNTNCTGHVVAPPCAWHIYLDAQLFWNDLVGLEISDGPDELGRYDYGTVYQVWRAANATRSHVIVGWYQPELLINEFANSDYSFQEVMLSTPTDVCLAHRTTPDERCAKDIWERRGDPLGGCGNENQGLNKLIAASVREFNEDLPHAYRSPAHEFIKNLRVSELETSRLFTKWLSYDIDRYGNDARESVCSWIVDNLQALQWSVPDGYPRTLSERSQYHEWWMILAQLCAVYQGFAAIIGMVLCYFYRESKVMVFAQVEFILLILFGFLCISVGAALRAVEPTQNTCISLTWFLLFGYTVELVPVLVKTAAINKLVQSAKRQKRVNINRFGLLRKVALCCFTVMAFLTVWTIFDTIGRSEVRRISKGDNYVVESDVRCTSQYPAFQIAAYTWEAFLLMAGTVLAVQSRDVVKEFNESKSLGIMVYSHLMFLVLRGFCIIFYYSDTFSYAFVAALLSYNYTFDAMIAMTIYVLPKFLQARDDPQSYKKSRAANLSAPRTSSIPDDDGIKVLCCTANIGNAEPTHESMEAWIPFNGKRSEVTPLSDNDSAMQSGQFHLIAIGMQESTWTESAASSSRKKASEGAVSHEDILNAMEDANTAALREMMQDILGGDYLEVAEDQRGQMRLYIFAHADVYDDINTVRISGANTGIGGVMANKGGIVVTLNYRTTRISFLSAHLAAHEGESYYKARCENLETIIKESRTYDLSSKLAAPVSSHHMFVMGDLNFRTRFKDEMSHEERVERALNLIDFKDYEGLYAFDELVEGLRNGDLLLGFETLPCLFPPTFKVQRKAGFVYKNQRTPSYTDRILFKSAVGLKNNMEPLAYEPCEAFITSDHKPMRGAFCITPNDVNCTRIADVDIHLVFKEMMCVDLPAADTNGFSDPYLIFMWDGIDLQSEQKSLKDKIRKLINGKSWPRTGVVDKTLNPRWVGETVPFFAKNICFGEEAILYVCAMDSDTLGLKDDFLGACAMNVKDLVEMDYSEKEKVVEVDQVLDKGGKFSGRFRCRIDVRMVRRKNGLDFSGFLSTTNSNAPDSSNVQHSLA
jgi:7 transmembrane sweet-taste receptor of 3 GCPR/C2 domain